MATYEIFPDTSVGGTKLNLKVDGTSSLTSYESACSKSSDCAGFSWDSATNTGTFYSSMKGFSNVKGAETYVKRGIQSYWYVWLLLIGIAIILFFNMCRRKP